MNSSVTAVLFQFFLICTLLTIASSFYLSEYPTDYGSFRPMKKSGLGQLRSLSGAAGRNCFFSPINCVITRDSSTYLKMAGSKSYN